MCARAPRYRNQLRPGRRRRPMTVRIRDYPSIAKDYAATESATNSHQIILTVVYRGMPAAREWDPARGCNLRPCRRASPFAFESIYRSLKAVPAVGWVSSCPLPGNASQAAIRFPETVGNRW
jgi:hypothetical protein